MCPHSPHGAAKGLAVQMRFPHAGLRGRPFLPGVKLVPFAQDWPQRLKVWVSAQQPPSCPAMETFFRRHFQQKARGPGEGQRRPSGVGLPTGKARRRSPAGQASSTLMQRRRSSAQLQGCFLGCGLVPQDSRRRSSTAPPARNPRFAVEVPTTLPLPRGVRLGDMEEEEDRTLGASQGAQPLLPVPRWQRRRRASHLLPADSVSDPAQWGLHGYYRRLSQQRPSGQYLGLPGRRASGTTAGTLMPARMRPLSRRRQVALRRKSPGPQAWSSRLV